MTEKHRMPEGVSATLAPPKPRATLDFFREGHKWVGTLDFNGAEMKFEGNAEESAKVFFDYVARQFAFRLQAEFEAGRQAALAANSEPFAYFQRNEGWNCWEEVIASAAGEPGVVAAYRHPLPQQGWVSVPKVPTQDMVIAGFESLQDLSLGCDDEQEEYDEMSGCQQAAFRAKRCWAAMIAAAKDES